MKAGGTCPAVWFRHPIYLRTERNCAIYFHPGVKCVQKKPRVLCRMREPSALMCEPSWSWSVMIMMEPRRCFEKAVNLVSFCFEEEDRTPSNPFKQSFVLLVERNLPFGICYQQKGCSVFPEFAVLGARFKVQRPFDKKALQGKQQMIHVARR